MCLITVKFKNDLPLDNFHAHEAAAVRRVSEVGPITMITNTSHSFKWVEI